MQLILASTSPYRKALLARLGVEFTCEPPEVDEDAFKNTKIDPKTPRMIVRPISEPAARTTLLVAVSTNPALFPPPLNMSLMRCQMLGPCGSLAAGAAGAAGIPGFAGTTGPAGGAWPGATGLTPACSFSNADSRSSVFS